MSRIKILSEVVISQIAAGEVIQRPASVVKELVDNSLDAGAGKISVDVEKGGNSRIEVSDDGCGMSNDELSLAVKRHATSKIEIESDLRTIQTHGFRGEALASICSVARVDLISRLPSSRQGYKLSIEGGVEKELVPVGCPPGATAIVSDLFYNTPARRKFMKTAGTEFERIGQVVVRAALARPECHFTLSSSGRKARNYPAVPSRVDRLAQILGTDAAKEMLPVLLSNDRIQVEGFTSRPTTHRKTAADLYFFVNGRFIRDKILIRALSEAYRASLPQRRYPITVLFIELPPDQIDVNVHPAKEEIRFADEGALWRGVYSAVREALNSENQEEFRPGSHPSRSIGDSEKTVKRPDPVAPREESSIPPSLQTVIETPGPAPRFESKNRSPEPFPPATTHAEQDREREVSPSIRSLNRSPLELPEARSETPQAQGSRTVAADDWTVVCQLFNSFILCESGQEIAIFDQHALHERILFEKFRKRHENGRIEPQQLLFPTTFEVPSHQAPLLTDSLPLLAELGLEVEPFGDRTFAVQATPPDLKLSELEGMVQDALSDLSEMGSVAPLGDRAEKVLARMACRSAIKANDPLETPQMQELVDQFTDNPILSTCPHGRPPIWRLSRKELERLFDRP